MRARCVCVNKVLIKVGIGPERRVAAFRGSGPIHMVRVLFAIIDFRQLNFQLEFVRLASAIIRKI